MVFVAAQLRCAPHAVLDGNCAVGGQVPRLDFREVVGRAAVTKQFTASEVCAYLRKVGDGIPTLSDMLHAYADRLEADEKVAPVAWRTFDGEGNYDYRDYENNEHYRDWYVSKNGAKYANWVEPLYTHCAQAQPPAVSVPDALDEDDHLDDGSRVSDSSIGYAKGWNACRKAALAVQIQPPVTDPARIQAGENAIKALGYIRDARRWDRSRFEDDRAFADWAQSWARHATQGEGAQPCSR